MSPLSHIDHRHCCGGDTLFAEGSISLPESGKGSAIGRADAVVTASLSGVGAGLHHEDLATTRTQAIARTWKQDISLFPRWSVGTIRLVEGGVQQHRSHPTSFLRSSVGTQAQALLRPLPLRLNPRHQYQSGPAGRNNSWHWNSASARAHPQEVTA